MRAPGIARATGPATGGRSERGAATSRPLAGRNRFTIFVEEIDLPPARDDGDELAARLEDAIGLFDDRGRVGRFVQQAVDEDEVHRADSIGSAIGWAWRKMPGNRRRSKLRRTSAELFGDRVGDEDFDPAGREVDEVGAEGGAEAEEPLAVVLAEVQEFGQPAAVAVVAEPLESRGTRRAISGSNDSRRWSVGRSTSPSARRWRREARARERRLPAEGSRSRPAKFAAVRMMRRTSLESLVCTGSGRPWPDTSPLIAETPGRNKAKRGRPELTVRPDG